MKAAVLHAFGENFRLEDLPDPVAAPGEAVVDIAAARVLPYMRDICSGVRRYNLELPAVLGGGAVGRIAAVGPDATRLKLGDWVLCDPTLRSRDDARAPGVALQGVTALTPRGEVLQRRYRHGSFAEKMLAPLENLHPIGAVAPQEAARWCGAGTLLVPYGGLLAVEFRPGEVLVVSGATGNFGGAAVMLGLALGANAVIALGRNADTLQGLERRFGPRVRGVPFSGDADADAERIKQAAPGPIDVVLDILPPGADPAFTRGAILSLREFGRAALMGGQQSEFAIPYGWLMRNSVTIRGQFMYPRSANTSLIAMAQAGLVDLQGFDTATFPLAEVEKALDHAAANAGAFKMTVVIN